MDNLTAWQCCRYADPKQGSPGPDFDMQTAPTQVGNGQHQRVPKDVFLEFLQDLGQSPRSLAYLGIPWLTLPKDAKSVFWRASLNRSEQCDAE